MKLNKPLKLTVLISIVFFTSFSCKTKINSDKFLGKWQEITDGNNMHPIIISKSGSNFIVETPILTDGLGQYTGKNRKSPATYNEKGDKLEVSYLGGQIDMIYEEKSKHLIWNGQEFKKFLTCDVFIGNWSYNNEIFNISAEGDSFKVKYDKNGIETWEDIANCEHLILKFKNGSHEDINFGEDEDENSRGNKNETKWIGYNQIKFYKK